MDVGEASGRDGDDGRWQVDVVGDLASLALETLVSPQCNVLCQVCPHEAGQDQPSGSSAAGVARVVELLKHLSAVLDGYEWAEAARGGVSVQLVCSGRL